MEMTLVHTAAGANALPEMASIQIVSGRSESLSCHGELLLTRAGSVARPTVAGWWLLLQDQPL